MGMSLHEQMNILSGLKSTAVLSLLPMVSDETDRQSGAGNCAINRGLAVISSSAFPVCHQALPPGRVPHVRGLSRTWVEHDLFSNAFITGLHLPTEKKEGLHPSCSTHVRESPRTWGTRPGGKASWGSERFVALSTHNVRLRSKTRQEIRRFVPATEPDKRL
jgi:hypothetical protein